MMNISSPDLAAHGAGLWPVLAEAASAPQAGITFVAWPEHAWKIGLVYVALVLVGLAVNVVLFFRFLGQPIRWSERVQHLKQSPWASVEALRLLAFLALLYFLVTLMQHVVFPNGDSSGMIWVMLQSILFHVAGLAFVVSSLKRQRLSWRAAFGLQVRKAPSHLLTGIILYLAMLPILLFYSALYQVGLQFIGYEPLPQPVVLLFAAETNIWVRAYMFLLAAAVAPLFEEVLFRGIALPVLARQRSMAWAVVIMSIVFAAIHFHLSSMVPLFIVAVVFSVGYIYSGSLLVPIVIHGLFNMVNLLLLAMLQPPV